MQNLEFMVGSQKYILREPDADFIEAYLEAEQENLGLAIKLILEKLVVQPRLNAKEMGRIPFSQCVFILKRFSLWMDAIREQSEKEAFSDMKKILRDLFSKSQKDDQNEPVKKTIPIEDD